MGTPSATSPEQGVNEDLDSRSDIFASGTFLYYILAGGKYPFGSTAEQMSAYSIIHNVINVALSDVPVTRYNKDIPAEVTDLLERLMKKERQDRPSPPDAVEISERVYTTLKRRAQAAYLNSEYASVEATLEKVRAGAEQGDEQALHTRLEGLRKEQADINKELDWQAGIDALKIQLGEESKRVELIQRGELQGDESKFHSSMGDIYEAIAWSIPEMTEPGEKPYKFTRAYYLAKSRGEHFEAIRNHHNSLISRFTDFMIENFGQGYVDRLKAKLRSDEFPETKNERVPETEPASELLRLIIPYAENPKWRQSKSLRSELVEASENKTYAAIEGMAKDFSKLITHLNRVDNALRHELGKNEAYGVTDDPGTDTGIHRPATIQVPVKERTTAVRADTKSGNPMAGFYNTALDIIKNVDTTYQTKRGDGTLNAKALDDLMSLLPTARHILDSPGVKEAVPQGHEAALEDIARLGDELKVARDRMKTDEQHYTEVLSTSNDPIEIARANLSLGVVYLGRVSTSPDADASNASLIKAVEHLEAVPNDQRQGPDRAALYELLEALKEYSGARASSAGLVQLDVDTFRSARSAYKVTNDNADTNSKILEPAKTLAEKAGLDAAPIEGQLAKINGQVGNAGPLFDIESARLYGMLRKLETDARTALAKGGAAGPTPELCLKIASLYDNAAIYQASKRFKDEAAGNTGSK
jgi:hypothetical protein